MSEWNMRALVKLKGKLKECILMTGLRDILQTPAGGFMSDVEACSVTDLSGEMNQIEQIITILLGKGDKEFATFTKMLRYSSSGVWANELESAAESFKKFAGMECCLPLALSLMLHRYMCAVVLLYVVFAHTLSPH